MIRVGQFDHICREHSIFNRTSAGTGILVYFAGVMIRDATMTAPGRSRCLIALPLASDSHC